MIDGFEEQTHELTEFERNEIVPIVSRAITRFNVGKINATTNKEIRKNLLTFFNHTVSDPRMRKVIHYIRVGKIVSNLVASSNGYYVENDVEERRKYAYSLGQRIRSIQEIIDSLDL